RRRCRAGHGLVVASCPHDDAHDHDQRQHRRGRHDTEGDSVTLIGLLPAHFGASTFTVSLGISPTGSMGRAVDSGSGSRNRQSWANHSTVVWFTAFELSEY